jgi:pimeloyl-ACP methyl ester carboxylesterase
VSVPLASAGPVAGGVDVDLPGSGVRLRATRWPGTGPAVLLLHGLASTRRFWDLVVPGLAGVPVVALDQRGHGDSDRPAGPYDGATVVRDVTTALDALGLSRVVVVGHSWGATTALRLAAEAPGRVLAAVAVDGGLGALRGTGRPRAELRAQLTPPRTALPPEALRARLAGGPLAPWWSDAVEQAVLAIFEVGDDGLARARLPFEAHMVILDDLLDTDHEALWAAAACPVWVVACAPPADGDAAVAALVDVRQAALERAGRVLARPRLLRWQGAVHDVPLQWPALVAGLVRAARDEVVGTGATGEGVRP